jgi:ABC-2 type transport system ATP-binding protein
MDDPEAQNPIIVRKLVEAGADVQFVGELRHSLEDVYLSLIKSTRSSPESQETGGNSDSRGKAS